MTFPLYGDSYGQLAGQQQNYDQFFNGINQANAARVTDANNRNLEMAFRARDTQAQDARTLATQDEDARRFALGLEAQAQNRADQISQAKTAYDYQQMAFKARGENDAALLQLERDKLAATQAGKIDPEEQALMLSDHLGQLREAADAATAMTAGNQQRIAAVKASADRNGYKLVDDKRGNLTFVYNRQTPPVPGSVTADQLNGALADAMKQDKAAQTAALRAKNEFEKNLWNAKQLGLQRGFTVDANGITTKTGSQYRFTPGGNAPASSQPQPRALRIDASGNISGAEDMGNASPPPVVFTPGGGRAGMDRESYGPPIPTESTGLIPSSLKYGRDAIVNQYNRNAAAIRAIPTIGQVARTGVNVGRYVSDALRMPAPYTDEYQGLMRDRASQDEFLKNFSTPVVFPDYSTAPTQY